MSLTPEQQVELRDLVDAACEGGLTADASSRLESLLLSDNDACRYYLNYFSLHGSLLLAEGAPSIDREPQLPNGNPVVPPIVVDPSAAASCPTSAAWSLGGWLTSYAVATVIMVAAILGGWAYKISFESKTQERQQVAQAARQEPDVIGRVTEMVGCRWDDAVSSPCRPGEPISRGSKYVLDSGLVELAYDSGAKVVLQGPCVYEADSDRGGSLASGRLIARVERPKSASSGDSRLFTVHTPTATVSDLGTEFGVEVDGSGATRSCVFDGKVEVQPREPTPQAAGGEEIDRPIELIAGQSIRVVHDAEGGALRTVRGQADGALFPVRPGRLTEFVAQERLKAFQRWRAYSQRLRKDPALVAYYTFETRGRDPTRSMSILPNVAATGEALDGNISGPRWAEGRFPGKFALRFWGPGYRDCVSLPESERFRLTRDFSFAVWFQSHVAGDGCGHLLSKGNEDWRLCVRSLGVQFLTGDIDRGKTVSDLLETPTSFHASDWHLIVANFKSGERTAKKQLYIDSRLVGTSIAPLLASPAHGALVTIGDNAVWGPKGEFSGLIDEVAIFSRALTAGDVQEMFAAGSPPRTDNRGSKQSVAPPAKKGGQASSGD
ncbi:MAG: LamG-like jellyroll fold domain-containing protein [Thermoguttaceae bacterium]